MDIQKRKIHIIVLNLVMLVCTIPATTMAQTFTYNHDPAVMNQFMITEGIGGKFTPDAYYTLLHKSYMNWAMANGKTALRTMTLYEVMQQPKMAEEIDSALTRRAKEEALNVADRQTDITWQTERQKIDNLMEDNEKLLHSIIQSGGTPKVREVFENRYNSIKFSIEEARDAYMPNSKRKDVFLAAYQDLVVLRNDIHKALLYFRSLKSVQGGKNRRNLSIDKRNIVQREHIAWQTRFSNYSKNKTKSKHNI